GQETILLIDDDSSQLDVISRLLAKLGYNALCAQGGEQALALIRECAAKQQPFPDLLILDMVMAPGLNGAQTYQHIKAINPHQKAIMLSGYEESAKVLMAQELGAGQFLRKPVTMEILARAIRAELDGAASLAPGSAAAAEGPAAHA
ncbi:MAG: response regulator, partial [Lentisphaerae bacterium]|nr:response regulator [Lentisphaerota bacterium]